jgi:hypothetical protein
VRRRRGAARVVAPELEALEHAPPDRGVFEAAADDRGSARRRLDPGTRPCSARSWTVLPAEERVVVRSSAVGETVGPTRSPVS